MKNFNIFEICIFFLYFNVLKHRSKDLKTILVFFRQYVIAYLFMDIYMSRHLQNFG